tara:strand:+ start:367 stop:654 length:288 start_codon:yes stop_codon:yes gene_type:complete
MKYLIFNNKNDERTTNNRVAQEQGANGDPVHSKQNTSGKVTQYWFGCLNKLDSEDCAITIPDEYEILLNETEQEELLTQEEFDVLDWRIDKDGDE